MAILRKLANVLDVPIAALLSADLITGEEDVDAKYTIVRSDDDGEEIPGLHTKSRILTPEPHSHNRLTPIRATLYTIPKSEYSSEGIISHTFDEFIYVVSGTIEIILLDAVEILHTGDSIYIFAGTHHNMRCGDEGDAKVIAFTNSQK